MQLQQCKAGFKSSLPWPMANKELNLAVCKKEKNKKKIYGLTSWKIYSSIYYHIDSTAAKCCQEPSFLYMAYGYLNSTYVIYIKMLFKTIVLNRFSSNKINCFILLRMHF